jgi:chloramphenicol 3-O phosphotransferase
LDPGELAVATVLAVATEVIVLNGGSSSGKSSIARRLQDLLDQPWVTLGVDDLLDALAPSLVSEAPARCGRAPLIRYGADGAVLVDAGWGPVEWAWYEGVASMARAGLGVIIDEVLLGGGAAQRRLAAALDGLAVLWVGVRCDPAVAAAREAARAERVAGMAVSQAARVHEGVCYDVVIDSTTASIEECARAVLACVQRR